MTVLPELASWLSEGAELLGAVMTSTMGPEQQAVKRELDGVADKSTPTVVPM